MLPIEQHRLYFVAKCRRRRIREDNVGSELQKLHRTQIRISEEEEESINCLRKKRESIPGIDNRDQHRETMVFFVIGQCWPSKDEHSNGMLRLNDDSGCSELLSLSTVNVVESEKYSWLKCFYVS